MSLADLRNLIKSIEVIKKAMAAMKIISMSASLKLKNEVLFFNKISKYLDHFKNFINSKSVNKNKEKKLYVFIGSQRGLCGNYNINMEKKSKEIISKIENETNFIFIGSRLASKMHKFFDSKTIVIKNFKRNLFEEIYRIIFNHSIGKDIDKIIFFYTDAKSIFNNEIKEETIIINKNFNFEEKENFIFSGHFNKNEAVKIFFEKYNKYKIFNIFFKSLIAEQSFRFIAMDKADKNAEKKLEEIKINYNKKRQENITKELLIFSNLV